MRLFLSCGLLVWGVFIGCMEGTMDYGGYLDGACYGL